MISKGQKVSRDGPICPNTSQYIKWQMNYCEIPYALKFRQVNLRDLFSKIPVFHVGAHTVLPLKALLLFFIVS